MTSNVKMILDEVNARIKLAEAKTAEDPSNFDSFPGAENDKAVAEEMKNPDPEVKEEGPASRTETTGAKPGSDAPVQQDHLYEADEPVLTPEKKPAETADANAKTASANPDVAKVASDILSIIKGGLAKKASCTGKCDTAAKPAEKTETKEPEVKTETKPEKKAENTQISLESKILDKLASVRMAKQAGAQDATALIKAAAEYQRGAEDATALLQKLAQALEEQAAAADAADAGAEAQVADDAAAAGAADAEAAIADAGAAEGGDEDPVTADEVLEAVNELVQEGQISEEDAATVVSQLGADASEGGEGEVTEDQIVEGIAQAIESGELSEEEAQQLVQELVADGADESIQDQVADAGTGADAGAEAEAAGAADAEAAIADAQKSAEALQKQAADAQIARYQQGFIQKCAEYGVDPSQVARYIQSKANGAR